MWLLLICLMIPFGVEPEEQLAAAPALFHKRKMTTVPFGSERAECCIASLSTVRTARRKCLGPFAQEAEEMLQPMPADSSSSETSESEGDGLGLPPKMPHVRSLGWEILHGARAAGSMAQAVTKLPARAKRAYNNSRRAAQAATRLRPVRKSFVQNGKDPARIKALLKRTCCECKPMVSNCFRQYRCDELLSFLSVYWSWPKWERQGMARCLPKSESLSCSISIHHHYQHHA